MHKDELFYSYSRTALKVGLTKYGLTDKKIILIPNFLCNSIYDELNSLGVNIITYDINDDLNPIWFDIAELCKTINVAAIVMVHYFGQHQDIFRFIKFCKTNQVLLIEDNAHGYGGCYKDKLLGTYGDIGYSSPRKFLNTDFGGCLYLNNNSSTPYPNIKKPIILTFSQYLKNVIRKFPSFYSFLQNIRYNLIDLSDPYYFQETLKDDFSLGKDELALIHEVNWKDVANKRRYLWGEWDIFARLNSLTPVFNKVHPESSPWAYPVYTDNIEHRNKWIKWGLKYNVNLFSWPALPTTEIKKNSSALHRWGKMLCFPLDVEPPKEDNGKFKTPSI
jgi:perosamine synthetase